MCNSHSSYKQKKNIPEKFFFFFFPLFDLRLQVLSNRFAVRWKGYPFWILFSLGTWQKREFKLMCLPAEKTRFRWSAVFIYLFSSVSHSLTPLCRFVRRVRWAPTEASKQKRFAFCQNRISIKPQINWFGSFVFVLNGLFVLCKIFGFHWIWTHYQVKLHEKSKQEWQKNCFASFFKAVKISAV